MTDNAIEQTLVGGDSHDAPAFSQGPGLLPGAKWLRESVEHAQRVGKQGRTTGRSSAPPCPCQPVRLASDILVPEFRPVTDEMLHQRDAPHVAAGVENDAPLLSIPENPSYTLCGRSSQRYETCPPPESGSVDTASSQ